ncbi:hypothetical protein D3C87_1427200 [compost metagenome]
MPALKSLNIQLYIYPPACHFQLVGEQRGKTISRIYFYTAQQVQTFTPVSIYRSVNYIVKQGKICPHVKGAHPFPTQLWVGRIGNFGVGISIDWVGAPQLTHNQIRRGVFIQIPVIAYSCPEIQFRNPLYPNKKIFLICPPHPAKRPQGNCTKLFGSSEKIGIVFTETS